jgi:predicted phosphate transport protein (TIGR00153 family)
MKIDRFFQLFVVKEKKFYPMFSEAASCSENAALCLAELLREPSNERRRALFKEIKEHEQHGDKITSTIYGELYKTFVTPFDREDINLLGGRLDTFLDHIHDAARRVVMYAPGKINDKLTEIGECILQDARLLKEIMDQLDSLQKNPRPVHEKCKEISRIEHHVDELFESYLSELFATEKDAIELVKLKNIVQVLEDTTDRAKEVSDLIRAIIIKFA